MVGVRDGHLRDNHRLKFVLGLLPANDSNDRVQFSRIDFAISLPSSAHAYRAHMYMTQPLSCTEIESGLFCAPIDILLLFSEISRARGMPEKDNCGRLCIRLDPLGGIAGDMFVAAVLDAFPELEDTVRNSVDKLSLGPDGECRLELNNDGTLVGRRFIVGVPVEPSLRFRSDKGVCVRNMGRSPSPRQRLCCFSKDLKRSRTAFRENE